MSTKPTSGNGSNIPKIDEATLHKILSIEEKRINLKSDEFRLRTAETISNEKIGLESIKANLEIRRKEPTEKRYTIALSAVISLVFLIVLLFAGKYCIENNQIEIVKDTGKALMWLISLAFSFWLGKQKGESKKPEDIPEF